MALNPHYTIASRNAALNALLDVANGGQLIIYAGSQPANADAGDGGATKLATFTLANPAFAAASGGTKALNVPSNVAASATGTATWYRIMKSDTTTPVADGSVGTATTDLTLPTTSIVSGATVSITSGTFTTAA
jgi:hypothetical protein